MSRTKLMVIVAALAIVAILGGGWFLGVQPLIAAAEASDVDRATVETLNAAQQARITELDDANDRLPELQDDLDELMRSIPDSGSLSGFLREISKMSGDAGVTLSTLTAGDAVMLSDAATAAAAAAPVPAAAEAPAATTEAGATPAPVDPAAAAGAAVPVAAVPGMIAMPLQISATGTLDSLQSFVDRLQKADRFISISGLTFVEDTTASGGLRLDIVGSVYVLPQG